MNTSSSSNLEVGYNIPAKIGTPHRQICTPALILDLDAFERNVKTMKIYVEHHGIRLRAHAKTHKSAFISKYLIDHGGACGICCQKLSEAEALINAGIDDVLLTNIVVDPVKISRLMALASRARITVCVDDIENARVLGAMADKTGVTLTCLVEIEVGHMICGIEVGEDMIALAQFIEAASGLQFGGIQAYQGLAQHTYKYTERAALMAVTIAKTRKAVAMLKAAGLSCEIVSGGGTGSYHFETESGVYNELQCGSYVFMDADYFRVTDESGAFLSAYEPSLFIYTSIISNAKSGRAICDAGLKAQSVDSGLPTVFGRNDIEYIKCIDEHGVLLDPNNNLKTNDRIMLVPGHCDPTCNLHDWLVGIRNGLVEDLFPITARGKLF